MRPNAGRTINGAPKHAQAFAANPILIVAGEVERELHVHPNDLQGFPRIHSRSFFTADERSMTPDYDLSGVLIADLLARAEPSPSCGWISFCAGPYNHPIRIEEANRVLLCDTLDGVPIPVDRGGPYRTLIPGHGYNMSVKWLDRVIVSTDQPDDSAMRLAEARERARQFKRNQAAGQL